MEAAYRRDIERVLGSFQAAAGVRLAAGIKILGRARPKFSVQYGLTPYVDAIDPTYAPDDLEAKKRQIREQLKAEGICARNRQLPVPGQIDRGLGEADPGKPMSETKTSKEAYAVLQKHAHIGLPKEMLKHARL